MMKNATENFETAIAAALSAAAALRADRTAAGKPAPEPPVFSAETRPGAEDLSSLRFSADGTRIRVLEEDGDVVLVSVRGGETLMDRADVLPLSALSVPAALRALRGLEGWGTRYDAPRYALRGKSGRRVVVFAGQLSATFVKRGGHVVQYAPVSDADAEAILRGTKSVYYFSGTSRFVVK